MLNKGCVFALTGNSEAIQSKAIETFTAGIAAWSSTGATTVAAVVSSRIWRKPMLNSANSTKHGATFSEAMTAIENSKETWCEADVNRIAGEIARKSPRPMRRKLKSISSARSPSRANNKQNPGNSAPP